jgi:hypothetical protein
MRTATWFAAQASATFWAGDRKGIESFMASLHRGCKAIAAIERAHAIRSLRSNLRNVCDGAKAGVSPVFHLIEPEPSGMGTD